MKSTMCMSVLVLVLVLVLGATCLFPIQALAGTDDTSWMRQGKYGIFLHYQYRILLGYSIKTQPQFPHPAQMTAEGWNRFVDGFNVKGFARQMAEAKVGWVLFCLDDHYFAWPCAPNRAFSDYAGYAPGEKCSRRDLILDLADALNARGVKLICYFAGLNGYMKEPQVSAGLGDGTSRGQFNDKSPPSAEGRRRRLAMLKEYADRYKDKIAGWWFDGMGRDTYSAPPEDWRTIESIVRGANPKAVIAFSYGASEQACVCPGVDDYTGGDTWSKQDLKRLTPQRLPAQQGILWHGKIYCGTVYHGQGDANQFGDQELIDWINTCNAQGGVCTLDWPFDPQTGLLKDFGLAQLKRIAAAVKADQPAPQRRVYEPTCESLDRRPVAPWWRDAKFGIYVHWTLASVPGWGSHSSFYRPNLLKSRQREANGPHPAKNDIAEAFFTAKGAALYAILPWWPSARIVLKDIRPSAQTIVTMLGLEKPLNWTPLAGGIAVEVPQVSTHGLVYASAAPPDLPSLPPRSNWGFDVSEIAHLLVGQIRTTGLQPRPRAIAP